MYGALVRTIIWYEFLSKKKKRKKKKTGTDILSGFLNYKCLDN